GAEALAAPAYADAAHAQDRAAAPVARGGGGSVCLGIAPHAADCLRCGPIAGRHLPHRFRDQLPLLVVSVYVDRVGVRTDDTDRSRTRPALRELSRGAIILVLAIVFWLLHKRHVEDEVVEVLAS